MALFSRFDSDQSHLFIHTCHVFRHTMATQMLDNGADIRFIQEMLGHASLDATQIYTHVSVRKLKEIHTATHPAATLESRRRQDGERGRERGRGRRRRPGRAR